MSISIIPAEDICRDGLESRQEVYLCFPVTVGGKKEPTKDRNNFQKEVFDLGHNLKGNGLQCWGRAAGEAF